MLHINSVDDASLSALQLLILREIKTAFVQNNMISIKYAPDEQSDLTFALIRSFLLTMAGKQIVSGR